MGTLVHFSIFPLDKGRHLSTHVARAVRIIKESGLRYEMGAMGTTIEGEWAAVMAVVHRCFEALESDCDRIIVNLKADYKKHATDMLGEKVRSVSEKLMDGEG